MSTKGPSNRYGNTNGSKGTGQATEKINYPWAKAFNKNTMSKHEHHAKKMGYNSFDDYAAAAVRFANTVDRANYKSVIDKYGTTYKWDPRTQNLVVVDKSGYVITFYRMSDGFTYTDKKGKDVKKYGK